ncbi:MAG: gamma-glutamyltransferase [Chloroflexota bacterium]|nr:gamma-glutamyltransferase [Chloroflexota bacterium]MDE2685567.1 gamma-glutamyltransferase [Chloroflexota bacterium]
MSITNLTRSAVHGQNGMVCSDSPLAAAAGLRVLQDGGTAFDAALAVAAVECVTIVPKCGLGGDSFILAYDATTGKVTNINSSGVAGSGAEPDYYRNQGLALMPITGAHSVTVPGEAAAWEAMHRNFCTIPMPDLVAPAIRYAEQGFPVPAGIARSFAGNAELLARHTATADIYLRNGRPPREGEILVNSDLANSIRRVAEGGADAYYRSDLTARLVAGLNQATSDGGLFTEGDFAGHQADVCEPISATYRQHTVYQTRPPSQGFLLLEMLNIVAGHDLTSMTPNSADAIHLLVEAKKIAYSDRNRLAGDPNFVEWPLDGLLSMEYADMRRDQIHPFQAGTEVRPLVPTNGLGDTTYFCVADGAGNAVSWIHSLSNGFGSGVVAPGTGVLFNNRGGRGFSLEPDHPNVIAPGKRTMHTLNCYLTTVNGEVSIVGGTPGGDLQPQVGIQMLTKLIDGGLQPQDAVESPRWFSFPGTDPATINRAGELRVEMGMPDDTIRDLKRMGHNVVQNALGSHHGCVQLIVRDGRRSVLTGASDPRGDGQAVGF